MNSIDDQIAECKAHVNDLNLRLDALAKKFAKIKVSNQEIYASSQKTYAAIQQNTSEIQQIHANAQATWDSIKKRLAVTRTSAENCQYIQSTTKE